MYITIKKPYLVAGGFPKKDDRWVFFVPRGTAEVSGCNEILAKLLPLCDGDTSLEDVVSHFSGTLKSNQIMNLIDRLAEHGILVDSTAIFRNYSGYASNPLRFTTGISEDEVIALQNDISHLPKMDAKVRLQYKEQNSPLVDLLKNRKSTRWYAAGKKQDQSTILELLWSMYGTHENTGKMRYTVPSGGSLYNLAIFLVLFAGVRGMTSGIYLWNHPESSLLQIDAMDHRSEVKNLLTLNAESVDSAFGFICIAANFDRSATKYGDFAYPLTYLEAGHSMQNAYLYCTQANLGIVEILGFDNDKVSKLLHLEEKRLDPVVCALFGGRK